MKKIATAVFLTSLLSISILAGEIPTSGIAPPPPPDDVQASSTSAPGEIPTGGLSYEFADTALDLIQMLIGFGI